MAIEYPSTASWDPPLLAPPEREWKRWLGPAFSLAVLAGVLHADRSGLGTISEAIPRDPLFWLAFLLCNFATPLSDWIIYRRLWDIPASGILALLRKHISNRLLFGYAGEIYFYSWARQHANLTAAPFGAIKDVAILSAVCGNLLALALLPIGISLLHFLEPGHRSGLIAASLLLFSAGTLLPVFFGRRLFSLPSADLRFVVVIQILRAIAGITLYAVMWHLLQPEVAYLWWLLLAALRQVVTRLPFVPDDEVVFTAMAVFFLGRQSELASLFAVLGGMSLALVLGMGALLGVAGLLPKR